MRKLIKIIALTTAFSIMVSTSLAYSELNISDKLKDSSKGSVTTVEKNVLNEETGEIERKQVEVKVDYYCDRNMLQTKSDSRVSINVKYEQEEGKQYKCRVKIKSGFLHASSQSSGSAMAGTIATDRAESVNEDLGSAEGKISFSVPIYREMLSTSVKDTLYNNDDNGDEYFYEYWLNPGGSFFENWEE